MGVATYLPFDTRAIGLQGRLGPDSDSVKEGQNRGELGPLDGSQQGERRKEGRAWKDRPRPEREWTGRPWRAGSGAGQDAHGKALIETEVARTLGHLHHCPRSRPRAFKARKAFSTPPSPFRQEVVFSMGSKASQGLSVRKRVACPESPQRDPVTTPKAQALFLEQKEQEPLLSKHSFQPHTFFCQPPLPYIVVFVLRERERRGAEGVGGFY